jgi:hypothetical protein
MGRTMFASIFGANMLEHQKRCRHIFELLANLFTDLATFLTTLRAGTILGSDIVNDSLPRQARRQRFATVPFGLRRGRIGRWRLGRRRLRLGENLVGEQQELSGVDLLTLLTVTLSQELFELMLKLLIQDHLLPQRLGQLADLAMSRVDVVRECGGWLRHTFYYGDA